ncbi:MazG-like family protein [Streptomyces sp. NPDC057654]|uniref:MazG-like family protein n=1 Tax=Streptomyces sp. NPDC057654 TaxID=3346196 RepID=UPI0036A7D1AE
MTSTQTTAPAAGRSADVAAFWPHVRRCVGWLDAHNGTGREETAMRLLKLSEEVGETVQAYLGAVGQNPRKGTTHTPADVADELCDVIITAAVALHRFADAPEQHMADCLTRRGARLKALTAAAPLIEGPAGPPEWCSCDGYAEGPCPAHPNPDH